MKFDAENPDEVSKSGDQVDRSQGAAKAITVREFLYNGLRRGVNVDFVISHRDLSIRG